MDCFCCPVAKFTLRKTFLQKCFQKVTFFVSNEVNKLVWWLRQNELSLTDYTCDILLVFTESVLHLLRPSTETLSQFVVVPTVLFLSLADVKKNTVPFVHCAKGKNQLSYLLLSLVFFPFKIQKLTLHQTSADWKINIIIVCVHEPKKKIIPNYHLLYSFFSLNYKE